MTNTLTEYFLNDDDAYNTLVNVLPLAHNLDD